MNIAKGYKTVIFGLILFIAPAALDYLGTVHWTDLGISPAAGAVIGSIIVALRAVTTTAIGKSA